MSPMVRVQSGARAWRSALTLVVALAMAGFHVPVIPRAPAADPLYSGPQPGEVLTPFQVVPLGISPSAATTNPAVPAPTDAAAAATVSTRAIVPADAPGAVLLVFVHTLERSLVPLLRVVDQYAADRAAQLRTEVVFLDADRLEGERRARAAVQSLKLRSPTGFSVDGAEGPGNYGLHKDCMMTLVAARGRNVVTNFALTQPGIADAPAVVAALAQLTGDSQPPTPEALLARQSGPRRANEMSERREGAAKEKDPFPGAVPTDARLQSLVRQFIRPTNDVATVDRLIGEIRAHIAPSADLRSQAEQGWLRILHFGDRYGTAHAREVARQSLAELQARPPRDP